MPSPGAVGLEAVWSAPGRVNLIGDHTDYNGGLALPFALPQRTVVRARPRADGVVQAQSAGHPGVSFALPSRPGEVTGWGSYVAGVAWALTEAGVPVQGADLTLSSEVPVGAGLSSSHSLECAVGLALCDLAGVQVDRTELALIIQRAENDYVGAPTGLLDQMAVLHSMPEHLSLFEGQALSVEQVPVDLLAHGLVLLVIDPNAPHQHVDGAYAERRRSTEAAAATLGLDLLCQAPDVPAALARLEDPIVQRRARYVLGENTRVHQVVDLIRAGELAAIGPVLTASHEAARTDFESTVPAVDLTVEAAVAAGALGARMTGGGFGGAVIALVEATQVPAVEKAVSQALKTAGLAAASFLPVTPSAGAGPGA